MLVAFNLDLWSSVLVPEYISTGAVQVNFLDVRVVTVRGATLLLLLLPWPTEDCDHPRIVTGWSLFCCVCMCVIPLWKQFHICWPWVCTSAAPRSFSARCTLQTNFQYTLLLGYKLHLTFWKRSRAVEQVRKCRQMYNERAAG
jgi:hypothetical protein